MQATLKELLNRPIRSRLNLFDVEIDLIATQMLPRFNEKHHSTLVSASSFYLGRHILAELSIHYLDDEYLPNDVTALVRKIQSEASVTALRMFYYLLMICHRESRHVHGNVPSVMANYSHSNLSDYTTWLQSKSSGDCQKNFLSGGLSIDQRPATLGEYVTHLFGIFTYGKFSTSYGGKPWARIAGVLLQFVKGEISGEMLVDTAWTLAHNTGHIFNKGCFFDIPGKQELIKLLDIQRSGQIPNYIMSIGTHRFAPLAAFLCDVKKVLTWFNPGDFVDYALVTKLGAVGQYSQQPSPPPIPKPTPKYLLYPDKYAEILPGCYIRKCSVPRTSS